MSDIPDGLPEDFNGEDDHMELGNTGLFPSGLSLKDSQGNTVDFEETDDDDS